MFDPIVTTTAYKMIKADVDSGRLSHAYLVCCQDEDLLEKCLISFCKLIAVSGGDEGVKRANSLIEKKAHPDVSFFPKEKKLSVADADEVIAQSVVKPMELDKRLFVLSKVEELAQYQNKLLKTLEEPPKNVVLIMGAVNENAVLATVRSRSKILPVPLLTENQIISALDESCPDGRKLKIAAELSGGRIGEAAKYYEAEFTEDLYDLTVELLEKMNKAGDVLYYASKMKEYAVKDVIAALKAVCGKVLSGDERFSELKNKYRAAVITGVIERLNKLEKTAKFNGNNTMLIDGVLFSVMEEKSRWQKLSV